jgi:Ran GTPase-activating protein (RanGAP) involved in mRNA processing and transport
MITTIVVNERKVNFEIDPSKLESDEVERNREALEKKLELVLKHLTSKETLEKMPAGIRVIAKYIAEFAAKTNNDIHILIGSFIFLRYLNPAVSSPEGFGLLPPGKVPSNTARRNLLLITKVLQNLANGKTFNNKELYMVPLNGFVEKHMKTVASYFDELVNFAAQPKTIHANSLAEVSINHLHTFHSLIFQHKDKILSSFGNEADAAEFGKMMEKLGSYEKKVSFSFLPEAEQKMVKQIMSARNDEATYVGYIEMMQSKKATNKGKAEKHVLIVGLSRLIWSTLSGKVAKEAHLLELRGITSADTKSLSLQFKEFEIAQQADDVDIIIDSIRRAFEFTFHSMPSSLKPKIQVTPESRVAFVPSTTDDACDGIVATYRSLCDFHDVKPNEEVAWDLENLYLNSRTFNLKKFTDHYIEPLTAKDALPLFHALAYNKYFTTLAIKHFKFTAATFQGVIDAMAYSSTIEDLTLSDVQISEKPEQCWMSLFEAMCKNESIVLRAIDLADSPMDDKCMTPLGAFFKKYTRPFIKVILTNTCGDKAGKANGLLGVFDAFAGNKAVNQELAVLRVSRNKLPTLEGTLTRVMASCPQLLELELAATQIDLNIIAQMGLVGRCENLHLLNLAGNKLAKPEQWTGLMKYIESNGCHLGELNVSSTSIPVAILKDILLKLNQECSISINASNNNLGLLGAQMLNSIGAQITTVHGLDISDNAFGDEGLTLIFEGFFNCVSLTMLNICRNFSKPEGSSRVRDKMVQALIQLVNQTSCPLESIHLAANSHCRLKTAMVPFIQALGSNNTLTEVDISGHGFGDKGAIALAKTLEINHVLTSVLWDDNNSGIIGLANIKDSISTNQNLKSMPLPWRDIVRVMNLDQTDKNLLSGLLDKMTQSLMNNQLIM